MTVLDVEVIIQDSFHGLSFLDALLQPRCDRDVTGRSCGTVEPAAQQRWQQSRQ